MRQQLSHIMIALGVLNGLAPAVSHATTFIDVSTETVARSSDRVVVGSVVAIETRWAGARIVTRVAMRPDAGAAVVWFEHPGGTVDDITMQVIGMPTFTPGERALVLLRWRRDRLRLVGLAQGKLAIVRAAGRDVVEVRRGPHGERLELVPVVEAYLELAAMVAPSVP